MSRQTTPGFTPSIRALAILKKLSLVIFVTKMLKGDKDKERREKYLTFYDAFWSKPNVRKELEAYANADDDFKYEILQGFIPEPLVGKVTTGYGPPWKSSDTFLTVSPVLACV
ncbi:hypothetical protein BDN71DRAFT_1162860 [Pleurotus eryngii]|uniref:Uncharacterized protein n=1 Tax=Pleurotus eryngii TaxID=5323 RepID=A0A9P5ZUH3_PLEER|nr:hypothetical protein BDN71DRAFT_1162860 [Pleurotus eryngii]